MTITKRNWEQAKANEEAILLARAQGLFYVIAGTWPLVSIRTFEAVTGPKSDRWLVKTTGLLIAVIGTTLMISARRSRIPPDIALLGGGSAAALGTSALVYALRGRISKVYLLDTAIEFGLATAWIVRRSRDERPSFGRAGDRWSSGRPPEGAAQQSAAANSAPGGADGSFIAIADRAGRRGMSAQKHEPLKPEEMIDDDVSEPPNPGDPGPEQPKPWAPVDPAEDPRIPPQREIPRGV